MTINQEEIDRYLQVASQNIRNAIDLLEANVEPNLVDIKEKNTIRSAIGRLKGVWVQVGSEFETWK